MQVERIGFTPLKGGRHVERRCVELGPEGPVGDRVFCLVDRDRARVLRTVEHPASLRAVASFEAGRLAVTLDGTTIEGLPEPTDERRTVDYWGRRVDVAVLAGPWAEALSALLGQPVALARPVRVGEVVYGGSVSLVATASLGELARRVGRPVESARFRPTCVVHTMTPGEEAGWIGRELRIGSAVVGVRGVVPRCAVVDLDPVSGERDLPVLRSLAGYCRGQGEVSFGVDAVVVHPGRVATGDALVVGGVGD